MTAFADLEAKLRRPVDQGGHDGFEPDPLHVAAADAIDALRVALASQIDITNTERASKERLEAAARSHVAPYQERVRAFMVECFGVDFFKQGLERDHRFLEESLELVQANGCPRADAHMLVDYVYERPAGKPHQECGGVLTTLAAVCLSRGLDMAQAGEDELARVWTKIDVIREKQRTKPKGSPLPEAARPSEGELSQDWKDLFADYRRMGLPDAWLYQQIAAHHMRAIASSSTRADAVKAEVQRLRDGPVLSAGRYEHGWNHALDRVLKLLDGAAPSAKGEGHG